MSNDTNIQKRPEGILQNMLTYFCFTAKYFSMRKLVKLIYLTDVYHYQMHNKKATQIPFKRYRYGPWAPDVSQTIEELYAKGILHEERIITKKGIEATIPKPNIPRTAIDLPKNVLETVKMVLEDWGNVDPERVVEFTKKTLPFLNTGFGERINFSRLDAITEYAEKKGISKEQAATLDIISNKKLTEKVLEGIKNTKEGKFMTHKQVFNE